MKKRKPLSIDEVNEINASISEAWSSEIDIEINQHTHYKNIALSKIGTKLSEEAKRKKSDALKGKSLGKETRLKISLKNKGRKNSEETKEKMRKASSRKEITIDNIFYNSYSEVAKVFGVSRAAISKRLLSNKPITSAILKRMRDKEREPISDDVRKKLSLAKKGKALSVEHKQKIAASHKGRSVSEKTRKKLSDINKNKGGKAVSINGIVYLSVSEAARQMGLLQTTVSKRLYYTTEKWKDWFFIDKK